MLFPSFLRCGCAALKLAQELLRCSRPEHFLPNRYRFRRLAEKSAAPAAYRHLSLCNCFFRRSASSAEHGALPRQADAFFCRAVFLILFSAFLCMKSQSSLFYQRFILISLTLICICVNKCFPLYSLCLEREARYPRLRKLRVPHACHDALRLIETEKHKRLLR